MKNDGLAKSIDYPILTVCEHYQKGLWVTSQRFSPYSNLSFSDEEVISIYLFGIMNKQREIKSIYQQTQRYLRDWLPTLPSYTAYVQRLNRLSDTFPALVELFCPGQAARQHSRISRFFAYCYGAWFTTLPC